ncbi:MAG: hypothetical protein HYZ28_09190 [Myxococcales bacterium]|nr:hypothetical protein [Myxococcales bacterium]
MPSHEIELEAIEALAKRGARLSTYVAAPIIATGVLASFGLYFVLRELQFGMWGMHVPYVTAIAALAVTIAPAIAIARVMARAVVRGKRPGWIDELVRRHGIARATLEEAFTDWQH